VSLAHPAQRAAVLADLIPASTRSTSRARDVLLVLSGTALVALSALVAVPLPFTPVPLTLQTFAVLLVGAGLGWRRAVPSLLLYAAVGMAGVPWFARGESGAMFASFGYIIGFVVAAGVVGRLAAARGDRTVMRTVATMTLGSLIIYAFGVPVLMAVLDLDIAAAVALGVVPFLIGDAIKVALAAGLLPATWKLVDRR
jgi:biotin transport system substrate-specific component